MKEENGQKVRLQFDFTPEVYRRLEALQEQSGAATKAGMVRTALALYETILSCMQDGGRVILHLPDGEQRVVVLVSQF